MNAAEFADLVTERTGKRPRGPRSTGWYDGHCPGHDDAKGSLTFRPGDRRLIVKCHAGAGCTDERIAQGVGKTVRDFFYDEPTNGHGNGSGRRVVANYDYPDEAVTLAHRTIRYDPKGFSQCRPDLLTGEWIHNLDGIRLVVYKLPELMDAMKERSAGERRMVVAEGEKDCDRLWALGIPATTNAMGAGKWKDDYVEQLKAAGVETVAIIPDNDRAGEAHASAVAASCVRGGLIARIARLSGLPPIREKHGEDVSDWLDAGHDRDELLDLLAAPAFTAAQPTALRSTGLTFTPLDELLAEPDEQTRWLVDGRLPSSGLSILAGRPKSGKSTLARCLALAVARGGEWLGFRVAQGSVLYLALEEKRAEVRRHFRAMGGAATADIHIFCATAPTEGLAMLRQAAEKYRPALIIVDPLLRFVRVRDANDYAIVSAALEPLLALARETGAHVLTVHHLGKGERVGGDAILGSTAIFGAVDSALLLKRGEQYRTLSSIQRYGDDLAEITLQFDPDTRILTAGPPKQEADQQAAEDALLEYLRSIDPPGVTEAEIDEVVEGRRQPRKKALRALVAADKITRTGKGGKSDPFRYSGSHIYTGNLGTRTESTESNTDHDDSFSGSRISAQSVVVPAGLQVPKSDPSPPLPLVVTEDF